MHNLPVLETAVWIAAVLLVLALFFAFVRMASGPNLPNRILGLDMIAIISIGIITDYIFYVRDPSFLIIAVIQSLVAFSGTVAVAKHLEKRKFS